MAMKVMGQTDVLSLEPEQLMLGPGIVAKMREMAPDGVSSQHQFVEILEQAINTINDELKREMSPDEMEMMFEMLKKKLGK